MIEYLVLSLIFFYFLIASIEDIKKREVYDYINFSLTFLIIVIAIFHSIVIDSFGPLKYVGFGLLVGFALGSFLYYIGIWGGGDAKFLIGFMGSTYYFMNFVKSTTSQFQLVYDFFMTKLSGFFSYFLDIFLNYLIYIDIIFMIILVFFGILMSKDLKRIKDRFFLLSIMVFLFLGLFYDFSAILLVLLGFLAFVLIFLAEEDLFQTIYFKIKRRVFDLKEGNIIDKPIFFENKILIDTKDSRTLSKEDLILIKENIKKDYDIDIRVAFPFSSLVLLNFVMYLFKIITLDSVNLDILSFGFKFLFFSFLAGGILTLSIITFTYIKNFKKIKLKIPKIHMLALLIITIIITIITIFDFRFYYLYALIFIYFLFKISKEVETFLFVSEKPLKNIVFGDWIVEDIIVNKKVIFAAEDFKLGVNEDQLNRIKELAKTNSNLNKIYVKDGIAFLPPMFIGFLIILLI